MRQLQYLSARGRSESGMPSTAVEADTEAEGLGLTLAAFIVRWEGDKDDSQSCLTVCYLFRLGPTGNWQAD